MAKRSRKTSIPLAASSSNTIRSIDKFKISDLDTILSSSIGSSTYAIVEDGNSSYKINLAGIAADTLISHLELSIGSKLNDAVSYRTLSVLYNDGEDQYLASSIDLRDGMLSTVEYGTDNHVLSLIFNTEDKQSNIITVDLGTLVDIYSAGDGLVLSDSSFYVSCARGLSATTFGLSADIGSGLEFDDDGKVQISDLSSFARYPNVYPETWTFEVDNGSGGTQTVTKTIVLSGGQ